MDLIPRHLRAEYRGVSFRAGGATELANQGANLNEIMTAGGWTSTAVARYIRAAAEARTSGTLAEDSEASDNAEDNE
jgi:hypothetical protein